MSRKALHLRDRAWIIERVEQLVKQMATRDRDPMRGDGPRRTRIPHAKRVLQNPRDACWEARPRMIASPAGGQSRNSAATGAQNTSSTLLLRPCVA
jgi:hypothetical protein